MSSFSVNYERWKSHPRRYDLLFMLGSPFRRFRRKRRLAQERERLLVPPIDTTNVEILEDPDFRASVAEARHHTLLDVGRLVNLWYLARQAGDGAFLEVGSYRGGGALHICNAVKDRRPRFYSVDPFEDGGFKSVGDKDNLFEEGQFTDTSYREVVKLLAKHPNAQVIQGFFPSAVRDADLSQIAFCHLDVDVYEATRESLVFLAPRMAPRSFIVLDDVYRNVRGVTDAVDEFLRDNPSYLMLPLFPSQGVLLSTKLWSSDW
jgi:O-methyltransferase